MILHRTTSPEQSSVNVLTGVTTNPTIAQILHAVGRHGTRVVVGERPTTEVLDASVRYVAGRFPVTTSMSARLALVEATMIVAGVFDSKLCQRAAPKADPALFTSQAGYGPRMADQLSRAVRELAADPSTRRAVVFVGRERDMMSAELPCTNTMQFVVREGRLHTLVSMRSWDAAWGLPVDVAVFGGVASAAAYALQVDPGYLCVSAGSLHVYHDHQPTDAMTSHGALEYAYATPKLAAPQRWQAMRRRAIMDVEAWQAGSGLPRASVALSFRLEDPRRGGVGAQA